MSRTYEALTSGLDQDFQQVIHNLQDIFVRVATKFQGRATHTYGVAARGEARIIVPIGFPQNDFLKAGNSYPVILRHSSPGAQKDNRARDGAATSLKFYNGTADPAATGFHDIMMNTGRVLFVRSARAFLTMVTTPNPERVEKLLKPGIPQRRYPGRRLSKRRLFHGLLLSFSNLLRADRQFGHDVLSKISTA